MACSCLRTIPGPSRTQSSEWRGATSSGSVWLLLPDPRWSKTSISGRRARRWLSFCSVPRVEHEGSFHAPGSSTSRRVLDSATADKTSADDQSLVVHLVEGWRQLRPDGFDLFERIEPGRQKLLDREAVVLQCLLVLRPPAAI